MWRAALCIVAAMAGSFGLIGCAGPGGDQNYMILKGNDNPREMFQTQHNPLLGPRPAPTAAPANRDRPQPPLLLATTTRPTAGVFSRRQWTRIQYRPASGVTAHGPLYFADAGKPSFATLTRIGDVRARLNWALAGSNDPLCSGRQLQQLALEPARCFLDVGLLPVNMLRTPPWCTVKSP